MPLHLIAKVVGKALDGESKSWVVWVVIGLVVLFVLIHKHH
jgi:hypothetical protein